MCLSVSLRECGHAAAVGRDAGEGKSAGGGTVYVGMHHRDAVRDCCVGCERRQVGGQRWAQNAAADWVWSVASARCFVFAHACDGSADCDSGAGRCGECDLWGGVDFAGRGSDAWEGALQSCAGWAGGLRWARRGVEQCVWRDAGAPVRVRLVVCGTGRGGAGGVRALVGWRAGDVEWLSGKLGGQDDLAAGAALFCEGLGCCCFG